MKIRLASCVEPCAQVGDKGYRDQAIRECRAYIEAIRKRRGPEPRGAALRVQSFPHDFGTYYETVCAYDPATPEAISYTFRCEAEALQTWEEVRMKRPSNPQGRTR